MIWTPCKESKILLNLKNWNETLSSNFQLLLMVLARLVFLPVLLWTVWQNSLSPPDYQRTLLWNETLQTLDGFEAFWCDRSFFIESCERDTEMEQICETFSVLHTEKFAYYLCADTFETRSGSFPRSSSLCRQPPFDRCFQINADFHDAAARFQKVDEHRTDDLDSCQRYKLKSGIFSHFLKYADENYRNN